VRGLTLPSIFGPSTTICYPFATISECLVHDLSGAIIRAMDQVTVNAERNRRIGVAKAAADGQNIHTSRDQHACMGMAQAVQCDLRHADLIHGATPCRADRVRALRPAVYGGKHETVERRFSHA